MTKLRILLLLAVCAASVAFPLTARAETRTESKPYTVGSDALLTECELGTDLGTGFGGACFTIQGNETSATLEIEDLTGLPVGGAYAFRNPSGAITSLGLFCATATNVTVPAGSSELVVYVTGPAFGTINCIGEGSPGAGTTGIITVTYQLSDVMTPPGMDEERECLEPVPAAAGVSGVTDDGRNITLTVKVLLDGVSEERARAVFAKAAESYAPLDLTLEPVGFEAIALTGDDAQLLLNQTKTHEGGKRPDGVDVVYTLTAKNMQSLGLDGVAGLADCIGGVRFPERAFAIGEVIAFEDLEFGPLTFYQEATARTAAHEIGHLMGGHHHYANCVESLPDDGQNGEVTPCTLMFNSLDTLGWQFSVVNGAVVRGHAVAFASP